MKPTLAIFVTTCLVLYGFGANFPVPVQDRAEWQPQLQLVDKSYLELFDLASEVTVSKPLLVQMETKLKEEKDAEKKEPEDPKKRAEKQDRVHPNRIEKA